VLVPRDVRRAERRAGASDDCFVFSLAHRAAEHKTELRTLHARRAGVIYRHRARVTLRTLSERIHSSQYDGHPG